MKTKKAVYAATWTVLMALACYLTVTFTASATTSSLTFESALFIAEIALFAVSLTVLAAILKIRRQLRGDEAVEGNVSSCNLQIRKALAATLLTAMLATATYAAVIYLASITTPPVTVERIEGYFQYSVDNENWVDAYAWYKVTDMSWYVRFVPATDFEGVVNVTWTLQCRGSVDDEWRDTDVAVESYNVKLSYGEPIYASLNGEVEGNRNWADENGVWREDLIQYDTFRIKVDFWRGT